MHWDTIRPALLRAYAQEGARDSDEGFWLSLIHEGSNKKRLGILLGSQEFLVLSWSYSGTLWWYSHKTRNDGMHTYFVQLEGVHLSQRNFVEFSIHYGEWNNSGRKR